MRRHTVGCILLLSLTLLLVAGFCLGRQNPDLLSRATSYAIPDLEEGRSYLWLSNTEVLYLLSQSRNSGKRTIVRRDLQHGRELLLSSLTDILDTKLPPNHSIIPGGYLLPSPDRKWLAGQAILDIPGTNTGREIVFTVRLDGSGFQQWETERSGDSIAWRSDSNAVLRLSIQHADEGVEIYQHNVVDPGGSQPMMFTPGNQEVNQFSELHSISPDRLLIRKRIDSREVSTAIEIGEMGFHTIPADVVHRQFLLPKPSHVQDVMISPDGKHIAYYLTGEDLSPLASFWNRIMHRTAIQPTTVGSLWVSDLDGKAPHLLGDLELKEKDKNLYELTWLPDSKHLSFFYSGLKVVEIE